MDKIKELLKGKKTYLQAAGVAVVVALFSLGLVDKDMATMALGLLGAGTVASLGAKIDRGNG